MSTTPDTPGMPRSEHLPLGLQEFVDYTNLKGTKLNKDLRTWRVSVVRCRRTSRVRRLA